MMPREKKYLAYGAAAVALLLLAQPSTAPLPPKTPQKPGQGPAKPKPTPVGKDGDVISYIVDPVVGIVVKTQESPDVNWKAPDLKPDKIPALKNMLAQWQPLIDEAGIEYRVLSNEIAAIMWAESGGKNRLTSSAGAKGLMQVMPYHFPAGTTEAQMFDPRTNIRKGTSLLAQARAGGVRDLVQMASIYNAGPPSGPPWTNEAWLARGTKIVDPIKRAAHDANISRWGYASQPGYIDTVVAAFNSLLALARTS